MRVQMSVFISGTRDGEPWPEVGGVVDLPADEAADMIANGYAEPVAAKDAETASVTPEGETAAAPIKAPRARKAAK